MSYTLHQGDCLDILKTLPAESVDAVITDPPYMIGAVSVGKAKSKNGNWADMENSAYWFYAWITEAKKAEKPIELMAHLASILSQPGGTILDPFMGSGTTGVAAIETGRNFIGIEREAAYMDIARSRMEAAAI